MLAWGIAAGAKLFDLRVLAGAWSAAPPESLLLLPYGPRFPVNPGQFFLPVSLAVLVGAIGALATGWRTPAHYRGWLWLSAGAILVVWLMTMIMMWRMNSALYAAALNHALIDAAALRQLAHRWVAYDWVRVVLMLTGFAAAVRAISLPLDR